MPVRRSANYCHLLLSNFCSPPCICSSPCCSPLVRAPAQTSPKPLEALFNLPSLLRAACVKQPTAHTFAFRHAFACIRVFYRWAPCQNWPPHGPKPGQSQSLQERRQRPPGTRQKAQHRYDVHRTLYLVASRRRNPSISAMRPPCYYPPEEIGILREPYGILLLSGVSLYCCRPKG